MGTIPGPTKIHPYAHLDNECGIRAIFRISCIPVFRIVHMHFPSLILVTRRQYAESP